MKIRPTDNRVVLEPIEESEKTKGGLLIPETAKKRPVRGTVVAVGPGVLLENGRRAAMQVKAGDTVYFDEYEGADVILEGRKLKVIEEGHVFARE